jgi:hypothetical protein
MVPGTVDSIIGREHAGIADDQIIMKSIALGWLDGNFPANAVVSECKSVDEAFDRHWILMSLIDAAH